MALLTVVVAACAQESFPAPDLDVLRGELRALHEASVQAHLDGDADFFARDLADDYLVVSGAEISRPSAEEVRAMFGGYLSSIDFDRYETTDGPIVGVSDDGSVGWIITQVEVDGRSVTGGDTLSLMYASAWLTLYRRVEGRWIMQANVSGVEPR